MDKNNAVAVVNREDVLQKATQVDTYSAMGFMPGEISLMSSSCISGQDGMGTSAVPEDVLPPGSLPAAGTSGLCISGFGTDETSMAQQCHVRICYGLKHTTVLADGLSLHIPPSRPPRKLVSI